MNPDIKSGRIVGILFIIGTVAGATSAILSGGLADGPDYLSKVAANAGQAGLVALFVLVMGIALAMVPAVAFPVLKRQNETLAVGYLIFRGALETVVTIASASIWLLLVVVARLSADSGGAAADQFASLGALLVKSHGPISAILAIVFSLGALMFYYMTYQAKLMPRWLSVWGLVGTVPYLAAGLTVFFGSPVEFLYMPLALQEMVMAVWLVVKGFNTSAMASRSAEPERLSGLAAPEPGLIL